MQDNGLSQRSANKLLGLIRGVNKRKSISIRLPRTYQTISRACKKFADLYTERCVQIKFDHDIFGPEFPVMESTSLDVLQQLARCLLQKDVDSFFTQPKEFSFVDSENVKQRLHQSFDGGDVFRRACEIVRNKFPGETAFPLCIGITIDGTTLNSSRSRSETPLNMFLLNDAPGTMKMIQVGYLPGDNLPLTESQFLEHMTSGSYAKSKLIQ